MTYEDYKKKLVPLEAFDPSAFIGNDVVPQDVCDFVLALAVAYNDLHDTTVARILLNDITVPHESKPSQALGFRNGLRTSTLRIQLGFIRELLALIADNKTAINQPYFKNLCFKLTPKGQLSWSSLYNVAFQKPSSDPLSKALVIIRKKVAFHYDAHQIGQSFKNAFVPTGIHRQPFISRGRTMSQTRFYFADAAIQKYLIEKDTEKILKDLLEGNAKLYEQINQALYEPVIRFIESRTPWQTPQLGALTTRS
jgi:hypothetical protein